MIEVISIITTIIFIIILPLPTIIGLIGFLVAGFWGALLGVILGFFLAAKMS